MHEEFNMNSGLNQQTLSQKVSELYRSAPIFGSSYLAWSLTGKNFKIYSMSDWEPA